MIMSNVPNLPSVAAPPRYTHIEKIKINLISKSPADCPTLHPTRISLFSNSFLKTSHAIIEKVVLCCRNVVLLFIKHSAESMESNLNPEV